MRWVGPVRLLKVDVESGKVVAERVLETAVWSLAVEAIQEGLIPHGEVRTT